MLGMQWYTWVALGVVVGALGFGSVPGITTPIPTQGSPNTVATVIQQYWENLTISPSGSPPVAQYSPVFVVAPVNTKIYFTIVNNDPRVGVLSIPTDARVAGTVGNVMHVTIGSFSFTTNVLSAKAVSHTFTINTGAVHLNVPIPPMQSGHPAIVSFTVLFTTPQYYTWNCMVVYPPPMVVMRGTLLVR